MTDVNSLDRLCRYCSPNNIGDGVPKTNAFLIRTAEKYLSVNVLPRDLEVAAGLARINKILGAKGYDTSPNGRFAVFSAGRIVPYMLEYGNVGVRMECRPSHDDPTHAGIAPATEYGSSAWYRSTRAMARALTKFFQENPGAVYPVL